MNITKAKKTQPDLIHQSKTSKSFLVISTNYQLEKLYSILKKTPSLVNSKDQKNETFLSYALKRKNEEIAELILTSPILDISYQDKNGNSYLHIAVINQLENIVRILINKGINVNMQNNDGNTALHFAYSIHDIKYISIIIENNGDASIKNNEGLLPEEIKKGSFDEIIDDNYMNLNRSNTQNNNNGTIEDYYKLKIDGENGKNDSIIMGWENIGMKDNEYNNTKNNLKYSLVDFSYSEDNIKGDIKDEDENEGEEEEGKENRVNQEKKDSNHNSDIFDLTSSITYKEKIASISVINSHVVSDPIFSSKYDKDDSVDDMVNLKKVKTNENKLIHNSLINKTDMGDNSYKNEYLKAFSESIKKNPKFVAKIPNCKGFDIESNSNNNKAFDFSTSISKGEKEKINNDVEKNNIKTNNENYENNYLKQFNEDFVFSPLNTIADSLNKKKNIIEIKSNNNKINNETKNNDYIYSNINKNLNLGNHPIFKKTQIKKRINFLSINDNNNNKVDNKNLISNSIITDNTTINIDDSLMDSHPKLLNSKSNVDIYSSEVTADNSNNYKNLYQNSIKHSHESLLIFLSEIKLEKYYNLMNSNGFEDIQLLIDEAKSGRSVTDSQLKEAGIDLPGDRAKILIRLQEKAGNFDYQIPRKVYYMLNDIDKYENYFHIQEIKAWLKELKVENYLENFVNGGYHSLELMLMQMETKNPINDKILKDDLGIKKIGHRARIINELTEAGKRFHNKLKTSMVNLGNVETKKICECILF